MLGSLRLIQLISWSFRGFAIAVFLAGMCGTALAEYRLGSGDVIEVAVFGRADLSRRTSVDVDGNISLPLVGEVNVNGMALTELRSKLKNLLSTNESVRPADVLVDLIEHRPFYIHGDVARAGSYPFKPNLTVRHAVALAGGMDITRQRSNNSPLEGAALRGRYNSLLVDASRQQIRITGLRAELEGKAEFEAPASVSTPADKKAIAEIVQLEKASLQARVSALAQEREYLGRALGLADANVSALDRAQKQDEEATRQQVEELTKIVDLSRRGLAAPGRVSEEQRATVLLKSREMDTASRLAIARQSREELRRKLEKADDRQTRVVRELQDAITALEGLYTQLAAVREQLALAGSLGMQMMSGDQNPPDIVIIRKIKDAPVRLTANEDMNVEPGDVIELKLKLNWTGSGLAN
ncbi:polysaccharide biosynthesis/export family protein [Microvirga sp. CF3062]|uniref:polysaccharide biosynthesis/export family protein n=1 Tax=Microvirga sp. CF3062 TaxID=3110182 RepID=UPI002E79A3FB|nr:polysaccharide biosynthesis/export family protein [Microvirga sp. CF3062]MEE1658401.1 polysaccharide biosynthesis/export family protein [Microvirga sp. CF3062]